MTSVTIVEEEKLTVNTVESRSAGQSFWAILEEWMANRGTRTRRESSSVQRVSFEDSILNLVTWTAVDVCLTRRTLSLNPV